MDKGPWTLAYSRQKQVYGLQSDDFEHDVTLRVSGDFATAEDFQRYCEWLRDKLNAQSPLEDHIGALDSTSIVSQDTK